jgi:isoleucyl-tRNA synthetase
MPITAPPPANAAGADNANPPLSAEAAAALEGAALAIWTTTPWTIPANLAVAVNGDLTYTVVEASGGDADGDAWAHKKLVVAADLAESLAETLGAGALRVLATFPGAALEGAKYAHPLCGRESAVVIGGDYITTESGTGLVHTAPGHGQEDYLVGQRYGLPLLSPVDDAGRFTAEAGAEFEGLDVQGAGNAAVIEALQRARALLREQRYAHKYPYDWRTKKPTIFRATDQWFASVEGFRGAALDAIRGVSWVPAAGENRIAAMAEGRSDWCVSRQRKWGVPIPAFYDVDTGEPLMTAETIEHVASVVAREGSDAWWALPIEDLLPPSLKHLAPTLKKGEDTMDVWFDSGCSWAGAVRAREGEGLRFPADLYLEGSDQHRGWFQSSLLTAVAATGGAPYRRVLTHGFVLDERGAKMSKSLGNVVDPRAVIEGGKDQKAAPACGADVLRLWVASVDYASDVMVRSLLVFLFYNNKLLPEINHTPPKTNLSTNHHKQQTNRLAPASSSRSPNRTASCAARCASSSAASPTLTLRATPSPTTSCPPSTGTPWTRTRARWPRSATPTRRTTSGARTRHYSRTRRATCRRSIWTPPRTGSTCRPPTAAAAARARRRPRRSLWGCCRRSRR